ncbi:hypothetical protein LRP67_16300 [Nocardioides sp. cx-169]|uniref:hypothetical protein n=1 Tax=Nocardioides sp. cx-169 TaxID=2899080 RepID=UPI001E559224|nr:hypothetical protein [Nocardioides sp. cx-169]MCD4535655.1 hypothetical protein [Nocardioides sp. cx-169]
MSALAQKIATTPLPSERVRRGPANACFPLYGAGDLEDLGEIERLRESLTWREVQSHIDGLLDIAKPLPLEKFRYHWRRRCFCWPEDLRR